MKNQKIYVVSFRTEHSCKTAFNLYFTDIFSIIQDFRYCYKYVSVNTKFSSEEHIIFDIEPSGYERLTYMPYEINIEEIIKYPKK